MSRVQLRADAGKLPIVDNDVVWNYALNDFEAGGHDGQESSIGDQSNPEDVAQLLKMHTTCVFKPNITPTFVSNAMNFHRSCELSVLHDFVTNVGAVDSMPTLLNTLN
jgi:hypothetical protein